MPEAEVNPIVAIIDELERENLRRLQADEDQIAWEQAFVERPVPQPGNFRAAGRFINPRQNPLDAAPDRMINPNVLDHADELFNRMLAERADLVFPQVQEGRKVIRKTKVAKEKDKTEEAPRQQCLYSIIGYKEWFPSKEFFGFELEVEGENLPVEVNGFRVKQDGSLRGENQEYIFAKPASLEKAKKLLSTLEESFKKGESQLNFSFRTSAHVHLNVMHLTWPEINKILYMLFLFENALVHYCGPTRKGNRFCLRMQDAYSKVNEFERLVSHYEINRQDSVKYSAINLGTIRIYGSIEIRCMRGTIDQAVLEPWFDTLKLIYDKALTYKSMQDIEEAFLKIGAKEFAKLILEEYYDTFNYPLLEQEMHLNHSLMITIPGIEQEGH